MIKYIQSIFNDLIPENKGYTYITTENIFIPIYKVNLSITKRKHTKLNLVEEMVLRIVSCGVADLEEISGILGLHRDILDITIGDLHVKEMAYHTSNKCVIMSKGREALKELLSSKREKDTISNIYVNSLNQEVFREKNEYIIDRCLVDGGKVHNAFDGRNIQFYRDKVSAIKEIFEQENQVYSLDGNNVIEELVSIDEVEDISVCFLKMPLHIYISDTGNDIDLLSKDNKLLYILDSIKSYVIEQIRKHLLLKNIFTKYPAKSINYPNGNFEEMSIFSSIIKKYATDKSNQEYYQSIIQEKIYSNRILINNEFEKLFELFTKSSNNIVIHIDNLDYWSKNIKFITLLTTIPDKIKYKICYDNVSNINLAEKRIKKSIPKVTNEKLVHNVHTDWLRVVFNDKYQIIGCPQNYNAIDSNTYITKPIYYLQKIN